MRGGLGGGARCYARTLRRLGHKARDGAPRCWPMVEYAEDSVEELRQEQEEK